MWTYICTYPSLGFAVFILSKFLSNLIPKYMIIVSRVYQYLQVTKNLKIIYHKGFTQYPRFEVYINADCIDNKEICRSTSTYVAILAGYSIFLSSKRQTTVAQSSMKAEYIVALEAIKETV